MALTARMALLHFTRFRRLRKRVARRPGFRPPPHDPAKGDFPLTLLLATPAESGFL
jgi:hypothetical protein